jgi:sugar phosphate isomerase/epimerase
MILPGLVSVTFRQLDPGEIIALAREAGLRGIMWGCDVHVKAGQPALAREIGRMTLDAGLEIEGLGSYYRAGSDQSDTSFERELENALAVGAPRIRVWAGVKGSGVATARDRDAVAEDLRRCDELARAAGVQVALEFHGDTLTDTAESAAALFRELSGTGVRLYWQPPNGLAKAEALAGLRLVLPWVDNVHVFHWLMQDGHQIRRPLSEGTPVWLDYLRVLEEAGRPRWAMLEFVADDSPTQLLDDARQLRRWLTGLAAPRSTETPAA